jgi:Lrp/AsnC family transcriptional regulator for asnA, asnC and gidA
MKATLDDVDRHILSQLSIDGRYKNTQLAAELKISESAVRSRIKHLQEVGAIQIVALCNPLVLGHLGARVLIDVKKGLHLPVLMTAESISQVNQISILDNHSLVYLDLTCRDLEQLTHILDDLRKIDPVLSIRILLLTKLYKDYSWNGLVGSRGQNPTAN